MTNKQPLPKRKNTRWDKHDYSHPGEYMITICVRDMKQILSKIVPVERGVENSPRKCPSAFAGTPKSAPPPTFHGITEFDKNNVSKNSVCLHSCDLEQTVGDGAPDVPQTAKIILTSYGKIVEKHILNSNRMEGITVLKYVIMPNHVHILVRIDTNINTIQKSPANELIPRFVGVFKRFVHRDIGEQIFQRSYYDHVIRDENDMIGAINYIENNPYRWIEE